MVIGHTYFTQNQEINELAQLFVNIGDYIPNKERVTTTLKRETVAEPIEFVSLLHSCKFSIQVSQYVSMRLHVYVLCMYVCEYVSICTYKYVCICMCTCVCVHVYVYVCGNN